MVLKIQKAQTLAGRFRKRKAPDPSTFLTNLSQALMEIRAEAVRQEGHLTSDDQRFLGLATEMEEAGTAFLRFLCSQPFPQPGPELQQAFNRMGKAALAVADFRRSS